MKSIDPYFPVVVKTSRQVNYPIGQCQIAVLDGLASFDVYFKGCEWVYMYHSDTEEVLTALANRGFVAHTQEEREVKGVKKEVKVWGLTPAGATYVNEVLRFCKRRVDED